MNRNGEEEEEEEEEMLTMYSWMKCIFLEGKWLKNVSLDFVILKYSLYIFDYVWLKLCECMSVLVDVLRLLVSVLVCALVSVLVSELASVLLIVSVCENYYSWSLEFL